MRRVMPTELVGGDSGGGSGGISDYTMLSNKPEINDVTLLGNQSLSDLGIMPDSATLDDVADGASRKLSDYVTKETGKGLSTEDYTTDEKTKLAGIAEGAEVNVQADWEAESGKAEILNKPALFSGSYSDLTGKPDLSGYLTAETDPTVPSWAKAEAKPAYTAAEVGALASSSTLDDIADGASRKLSDYVAKETGKGLSTEDYTTDEKTKLAGIAEGAEVNVQADWEAADTTADDYIANKPTLAAVATSGNYSDLSGKPTIPDVSGKQDVSTIVEDTVSTDITVTLADNTEYYYGTLTSLSVSLPSSGKYQAWARFTSGTTATSCTFTGITWAGGSVPTISAGKTYEISVKDGYGTCQEF